MELEGFDAVFLLDFILERVGPHVYNQGLRDAQRLLTAKFEQIGEAIYEIEKPAKL